jgi:type VI protein secretion system component Hcp
MSKVIITSESTGGSGGQSQITENVGLNFESITITDSLTGAKDCFNSVTNSTC